MEGDLYSKFLYEGQLLTLHKNFNYNLTTGEETMFLLTIVNEGNRQKFEKPILKKIIDK